MNTTSSSFAGFSGRLSRVTPRCHIADWALRRMGDDPAPLSSQIQLLSDIHSRFQSLRHIPRVLLRPPSLSAVVPSSGPNLRPHFQQLEDIVQALRSPSLQQALHSAHDSLVQDSSGLAPYSKREYKKHSHIHLPDSPQPYLPPELTKPSAFPRDSSTYEVLTVEKLVNYTREFNEKRQSTKLHIWAHTPGQTDLVPPITLRFSIPDVLSAFLSLNYSGQNVIVETISVYGPREKKIPQVQSDFTVFRCLSRQISKMLHLQAQPPLQSIVELLESYSGLFIEKCAICERVLSAEGHIPPVVRVWTTDEKEPNGKWQARHIMCRQG